MITRHFKYASPCVPCAPDPRAGGLLQPNPKAASYPGGWVKTLAVELARALYAVRWTKRPYIRKADLWQLVQLTLGLDSEALDEALDDALEFCQDCGIDVVYRARKGWFLDIHHESEVAWDDDVAARWNAAGALSDDDYFLIKVANLSRSTVQRRTRLMYGPVHNPVPVEHPSRFLHRLSIRVNELLLETWTDKSCCNKKGECCRTAASLWAQIKDEWGRKDDTGPQSVKRAFAWSRKQGIDINQCTSCDGVTLDLVESSIWREDVANMWQRLGIVSAEAHFLLKLACHSRSTVERASIAMNPSFAPPLSMSAQPTHSSGGWLRPIATGAVLGTIGVLVVRGLRR